ncbi:unnamed protein product [Rhizophagus irregularis]|nr:unnamed protein product [Rhizophagus irregularis]
MPFKWYTALVAQDPNNRKAFKRSNGSWIVVDYSSGLRVLDLHNEKKAFDFTYETTEITSVVEEKNSNAGYLFIRNQETDQSLIPLLLGYVVFTIAGKKRFKLSILESNNQLLFYWKEFGFDTLYTEKKAQGLERVAFHYMLKKYGLDSNNSIQYIFGLNVPEIVNKLKELVYEKFATLFQDQEPENPKLANAKKKEATLRCSLKRDQEKIDTILYENDENSENIILHGIQVESRGKLLSLKKTQVLMLKNMEHKKTIYSQNRTIKTLKEKITPKNETDIDNKREIKKLVANEIEEKKLGSTIFMSTSHYLSILLSLPCPNCLDNVVSNRKFHTTVLGFNITCNIDCLLCKTSTQYSNEDPEIKYSHLVAGATLSGEINRNSLQTALATIRVTNQCSKTSYHNYQNRMYKPIVESAKMSSRTILLEILDHLEDTCLPGQEKVI